MLSKSIKRWMPSGLFFVAFLVVAVLALPFGAQRLGIGIPDSFGSFWGSAIGAAIAVLGALYLENCRRRETRKQVAAWAFHCSNDVICRLNDLNECYGRGLPAFGTTNEENSSELTPNDRADVRKAISEFSRARLFFNKSVERLSPHLINLDITEIRNFYGLEHALGTADAIVQRIDEQLSKGEARSMKERRDLNVCCRNLGIFDRRMSRYAVQSVAQK